MKDGDKILYIWDFFRFNMSYFIILILTKFFFLYSFSNLSTYFKYQLIRKSLITLANFIICVQNFAKYLSKQRLERTGFVWKWPVHSIYPRRGSFWKWIFFPTDLFRGITLVIGHFWKNHFIRRDLCAEFLWIWNSLE